MLEFVADITERFPEAPLLVYGIGLRPLEEAAARTRIPILAIGGIPVERVRDVRKAGAYGVAVISSILASDDVAASTRAMLDSVTAPL